ncbi:MAG: hypothetical protein ACPGWS_09230 [Solirubrobacterales bacterium]
MNEPHDNSNGDSASPRSVRFRQAKIVLSVAAMLLGIATIIVTIANGGGVAARGILLGAVLALMAGIRLFLTLRHNV